MGGAVNQQKLLTDNQKLAMQDVLLRHKDIGIVAAEAAVAAASKIVQTALTTALAVAKQQFSLWRTDVVTSSWPSPDLFRGSVPAIPAGTRPENCATDRRYGGCEDGLD